MIPFRCQTEWLPFKKSHVDTPHVLLQSPQCQRTALTCVFISTRATHICHITGGRAAHLAQQSSTYIQAYKKSTVFLIRQRQDNYVFLLLYVKVTNGEGVTYCQKNRFLELFAKNPECHLFFYPHLPHWFLPPSQAYM